MPRPLALVLIFLASLPGRGDAPKAVEPPKEIYRVWLHSVEEDTDAFEFYRPEGFDFPPARGREGFEVKPKGVFISHEIAPTDGTDLIEGRWTCKSADELSVTFPDAKPRELLPGEEIPPPAPRTLKIASCDKTVLKLKKSPPAKAKP